MLKCLTSIEMGGGGRIAIASRGQGSSRDTNSRRTLECLPFNRTTLKGSRVCGLGMMAPPAHASRELHDRTLFVLLPDSVYMLACPYLTLSPSSRICTSVCRAARVNPSPILPFP
ncbi:unnamed protein product, partial [Ectocarpus sp. 13 AM-2016]